MAAASPAPAPKDWAALPSDLLWRVFAAAGQEEILRGAGLACSAWRRAARDEPALWRRIDLHSDVAAHGADSSFSDDDDDDGDSDGYSVPVDDGSRSDALVEESDSNDAENNGDDAASVQSNRSSDDFFGFFSDAFVEESDSDDAENNGDDAASVQSNHSSDDDDFGFSDAFVDVEESDDDDDVPRKESADYKYEPKGWKEMARAAVDRSAGECVAFWGRADDKLLLYLSDRAPYLKSLRVSTHYDVSCQVLTNVIQKLPMLKELELVLKCSFYYVARPSYDFAHLLQSAMKSCIHLKSFAIRCADKSLASTYYHDDESQEAFAVPKKHGLRSLTLSGDTFTKPIILSVLNCCPKLRSLDVTNVAYLRMDEVEELRNKCLKIKDFRLFSPPPKVSSSESDDDCIGGCCCCDSWY